tara:strand:+ start:1398 stop:1727 length:330 start_codon:yes stop_codon:yes gene_type:complete
MANTFKIKTDTAVGTGAATIYTCPSATQTTIIGLSVANIVASQITVDVQLENNDGDNIYLVKAAPVPVGSALVVVGGDQKVVMEASDVLKVTTNTASSGDVALSILEIT